VTTGLNVPLELKIDGTQFSEHLRVGRSGQSYVRRLILPPGSETIHFSTSAKPVATPGNGNAGVFRVENFRLQNPLFVPHVLEAN